ncbi:MAG: alcohol dehydrogenase catalytic domain-containing protein [Planctomycetota bacterium]
MQALVFDGTQPILEPRRDEPVAPPGECLIRPTRLGVCSTDLEICRGYMGFTGVLGHEFVGVVEVVAEKKDADWIGKRVVGNINCVRSICDLCKAGLRDHARDRSVLGIFERDGCFSDLFALPVENLYEVPENVSDDHAVFTEPLAAAFQILRQLTVEGRPYITVLGDGRLGLLVAQLVNQLNATVRVVGKHEDKLARCEKWGIKHRLLGDVGLRQDQDIVIDCTGSARGIETAMQMVRPRGTIVMKTTTTPPTQDEPHIDLSPLVIHEINLIGSRCGPFPDALEALSAQTIDVDSLISKRMKLADGVAALMAATRSDIIKILLEP